MDIGIEKYIESLPVVDQEEAERRYMRATTLDSFGRAEILAAFGTIDSGAKMVYIIGRGPFSDSDEIPNAIYFLPYVFKKRFSGEHRQSTDIERVEIRHIGRITPLVATNINFMS